MIGAGRNFIIFADYPNTQESIPNSFPASDLLDPFANRTNVNGLRGFLVESARNSQRNGKFYVYQLVVTPFGGRNIVERFTDAFETSAQAASIAALTARFSQVDLLIHVEQATRAGGHTPNIAMVDFVDAQNIFPTCMFHKWFPRS